MLAAEGGFAGLTQRGKGTARKFTDIAGNVCGEGAAAALGKLKGEMPPSLGEQRGGFPPLSVPPLSDRFCRAPSEMGCGHEGSTAERDGEDTNQLDRSVISTHSLLSMPSLY